MADKSGITVVNNGLMTFIGSDEGCTNSTAKIVHIPALNTNNNRKKNKVTSLKTTKKRKNLKKRKRKQIKLGLK